MRFNLNKNEPFDMDKVKEAFKAQGFREVTLKSAPKEAADEKK